MLSVKNHGIAAHGRYAFYKSLLFGVENTCMAMFIYPAETKKLIDSVNT